MLAPMARLTQLSRSVAGRVVLITGAASGMGRATAHLFADEGARVAVTDLDQGKVDVVVEEIHGVGGEAAGWALDVADLGRIHEVVEAVQAALGDIDVLVNNAGIAIGATYEQDDEAYEPQWQRAMDVMLTSHQRLVRACLSQLCRNGEGRIINIASTEGLGATKYTGPYTAAKHGVIGLTRSMAVELGAKGVDALNLGVVEALAESTASLLNQRQQQRGGPSLVVQRVPQVVKVEGDLLVETLRGGFLAVLT